MSGTSPFPLPTTTPSLPTQHNDSLGKSRAFSPSARRRYIEHFGPLNYKISLANHTLVMLDAPGLVEEDYRRAQTGLSFDEWPAPLGGATDFISSISAGKYSCSFFSAPV